MAHHERVAHALPIIAARLPLGGRRCHTARCYGLGRSQLQTHDNSFRNAVFHVEVFGGLGVSNDGREVGEQSLGLLFRRTQALGLYSGHLQNVMKYYLTAEV